ncbi:hypothetical protein [Spirosoma terrae]|uniref:hypothetical protein n=1 Tax=Spirosoma terrae TaxID=1968276 RepID=UPI001FE5F677|nr:hypothetical protein [Spirosoma terrae]
MRSWMALLVGFNVSFVLLSNASGQDTMALAGSRHRQSLSMQLGTMGVGLFYQRKLTTSERWVIRAGGQYAAYRKPIRVKTAPESYIQIDPDFVINIAQVSMAYYPFRRSAFFVVGGAGYTWHPYMNFVVTANDKLNLGGLELTPEDVGTVDLGFRWQSVVGYLGMGFGQAIPRKRIGIGVELGVYYLGRPSVNLDYEGFLETTTIDEQVPVVERNLSGYRYLPAINLTITYKLRGQP